MNRHARRAAAAKAAKSHKPSEDQAISVMKQIMEESGTLGNLRTMIEGFEGFAQDLSSKIEELLAENARLMQESVAQQEITIRVLAEVTGHSREYLQSTWGLIREQYEKEMVYATEVR